MIAVRRTLVALAVVAAVVLLGAGPAGAIPDLIPGGGCDGPVPTLPGRGATGFFTSTPDPVPTPEDPFNAAAKTNLYEQYSLAGFHWSTCDIKLGPDAASGQPIMTDMANAIFSASVLAVGVVAAVASYAFHPEKWLDLFTPLLTDVVGAIYNGLTAPLVVVVGIAVACYIGWKATRWSMSQAAATLGLFVLICAGIGLIVAKPTAVVEQASRIGPAVVGSVNASTNTTGHAIGSDPGASFTGKVVDAVLYRQWLAGMFGSSDSPTAVTYGPKLFQAQTLSWDEQRRAAASPEAAKKISDGKRSDYSEAMKQIKDEDPDAYEYATGRRSGDRIQTSLLTLFIAVCVLPFLLAALVLLLAAPIIALVATVMFLAGALLGALGGAGVRFARGPLDMLGAAIINACVMGVAATVYILAIGALFNPRVPAWLGAVGAGLLGYWMWKQTRPARKLTQMFQPSSKSTPVIPGLTAPVSKGSKLRRGVAIAAGVGGGIAGVLTARELLDDDEEVSPVQAGNHASTDALYPQPETPYHDILTTPVAAGESIAPPSGPREPEPAPVEPVSPAQEPRPAPAAEPDTDDGRDQSYPIGA